MTARKPGPAVVEVADPKGHEAACWASGTVRRVEPAGVLDAVHELFARAGEARRSKT